jgi:hypothetical protein
MVYSPLSCVIAGGRRVVRYRRGGSSIRFRRLTVPGEIDPRRFVMLW